MSRTPYLDLNIPDKSSKGFVVTDVFEPNFTKLDQEAERVNLRKMSTEDNIEELKKANRYEVGDVVEVLGYYEEGDGAGHSRQKKPVGYNGADAVIGADGSIWGIIHSGEVNVSWFGTKGDSTNETDTFQKINTYINNDSKVYKLLGNNLIYTVGRQIFAGAFGKNFSYRGEKILSLNRYIDVENLNLKFDDNLKIGGFDPVTGKPHTGSTENLDYMATVGILIELGVNYSGTLRNVKLYGNKEKHTLGSPWGDTGYQCTANGISNLSNHIVKLENVIASEFGQDCFYFGGKGITYLDNCHASLASRNNLSIVQTRGFAAVNCTFNKAGWGSFSSEPKSNVDIEIYIAQGNLDGNKTFINCNFDEAKGACVVEGGYSNDNTFINCSFVVQDVNSLSIDFKGKENSVFDNCRFNGRVYRIQEATFTNCVFDYVFTGYTATTTTYAFLCSSSNANFYNSIVNLRGNGIASVGNSKFKDCKINMYANSDERPDNGGYILNSGYYDSCLFYDLTTDGKECLQKHTVNIELNNFLTDSMISKSNANKKITIRAGSGLLSDYVYVGSNVYTSKPIGVIKDGVSLYDKVSQKFVSWVEGVGWKRADGITGYSLDQLDTPYHAAQMSKLGMLDSYHNYLTKLHEYEKSQNTQSDTGVMNLNVIQPPVIPAKVEEYAKEYNLI